MPGSFYWAFFSYSSKDADLSRRLYRRLETYAIPRDLVGRPGRDGPVPKRLFPCFRDRDELPLSADLGGSIEDALRASRYLIVICTPDSARSRWVNEEVRFFKSLGRGDRILAIIAGGEPNASDRPGKETNECFAAALRYAVDETGKLTERRAEPIAGDLRPGGDGRTSAFLKAVAGITGLGYNAFAQREAKRRRRRQIAVGGAVLVALASVVWAWDYFRTKASDYRGVGSRWSSPEGVVETSGSATRRGVHYRFEWSRRKLRRVTKLNGSGQPLNEPTWMARRFRNWFIARMASWRRFDSSTVMAAKCCARITERCARTKTAAGVTSSTSNCATRKRRRVCRAVFPLAVTSSTAQSDSSRTEITGEVVDYTNDGRIARIQYVNAYRMPRPNGDGIFGQRFAYNELGLDEKIENRGPNRDPAAGQNLRGLRETHP